MSRPSRTSRAMRSGITRAIGDLQARTVIVERPGNRRSGTSYSRAKFTQSVSP